MTNAIKKFLTVVTTGTSGNYDQSTYPVKISGDGSVSVSSGAVVSSTEAQRQIGAARELQKIVTAKK